MRLAGHEVVANVKVGRQKINPKKPSHVPGVLEGNAKGHLRKEVGIHRRGFIVHRAGAWGTARRSTGIRPFHHNAIIPFVMPNLSPS